MADILRRWIAAYLSDHPDSVLQLTGGHDSRILLAAIPLDSGLAPSRLGTRSPVTRVATSTLTARKVLRKVSQRLSNGRRPQLGAGQASALVLEHWRSNPAACAALYDLPFLRHQWLDEVLAGQRAAAPTTAAFLVNLVAAKS